MRLKAFVFPSFWSMGLILGPCLQTGGGAYAAEAVVKGPSPLIADPGQTHQQENPSYSDLFPTTEILEWQVGSGDQSSGFDDEDRSFSDELKARNFNEMRDLARAIPAYVDVPNPVRALLTSGKLSVRMKRTADGWRPVRIDGEPYLRAIFAESWIYLSKRSPFRQALEKIDYPAVRFEVNLTVSTALAFDEKPRMRIQGNFVTLEVSCKRATAKEWQLLSAWQADHSGAIGLGVNVIGLAHYIYDTYKNYGQEDPILQRLRLSPAYKAPLLEQQ